MKKHVLSGEGREASAEKSNFLYQRNLVVRRGMEGETRGKKKKGVEKTLSFYEKEPVLRKKMKPF